MDDLFFMGQALAEAKRAYNNNETPIGCVIVSNGEIIARACNERNAKKNVLGHAEIIAINAACGYIGDWRLDGCRIYVTAEPCPMCAGAIVQARIPFLIFGAKNPKAGSAGSVLNIVQEPRYNHQVVVISGLMGDECGAIISDFFKRFRLS